MTDRALYRALAMQAALVMHPLASAQVRRSVAEDIAATIEAFATEPAPELLTAQLETTR